LVRRPLGSTRTGLDVSCADPHRRECNYDDSARRARNL
jgi:hypothetical protein